jgi:hypothetical protein
VTILRNIFFFFLFSYVFKTTFADTTDSGASIVGDGGYAVVCSSGIRSPLVPEIRSVELLDLFEAQLNEKTNSTRVALGKESESAVSLFALIIERLGLRLNISDSELNTVARAGQEFLRLQSDPWSSFSRISNPQVLRVRGIHLSGSVERALRRKGCYVAPIVVRPKYNALVQSYSQRACQLMKAQSGYCFFTDRELFRELKNSHKACLALHEALRYLPETLRPRNDQELRLAVAEVCL